MSPYAQDIRAGRAAVERILDEIGLRGFVFTIEATEPGWRLRVDCRTKGGWQTIERRVDLEELHASLRDDALRARLCDAWRKLFENCARPNV